MDRRIFLEELEKLRPLEKYSVRDETQEYADGYEAGFEYCRLLVEELVGSTCLEEPVEAPPINVQMYGDDVLIIEFEGKEVLQEVFAEGGPAAVRAEVNRRYSASLEQIDELMNHLKTL